MKYEEQAIQKVSEMTAAVAAHKEHISQMNNYTRIMNDLSRSLDPNSEQLDYMKDDVNEVYDMYNVKNSILAANIGARMFSEGIAKCVEHKFFHRRAALNMIWKDFGMSYLRYENFN